MIKEWFRNSRMGFTSGQAGIMRRMLREEGGWQSHLVNSSEYIREAVKLYKPKSIRILGSGWLLDLPVKFLEENCDRVILTDITHPNQILNKYFSSKKIVFETIDITGNLVELGYQQRKKSYSHQDFIQSMQNSPNLEFNEDLVVSLNLASQLSIFLTDYLSKQVKISNNQAIEIAEAIQLKHFRMLPIGKSVLISDFEEEYYDEDDKFIGSKPTVIATIPAGNNRKEWVWHFDSKMMYKTDCKTKLRVVAIRL